MCLPDGVAAGHHVSEVWLHVLKQTKKHQTKNITFKFDILSYVQTQKQYNRYNTCEHNIHSHTLQLLQTQIRPDKGDISIQHAKVHNTTQQTVYRQAEHKS